MICVAPKLSDFVCITESVELGAKLSNLFSKKNTYFPILEPPRTTRPDADIEATKINNAIARLKPEKIIFAALSEQQRELLYNHFPRKMVIDIKDNGEIEGLFKRRVQKLKGQITVEKENISQGLYSAIKERKNLKISESTSNLTSNLSGLSSHLLVVENLNDITSIIATNYAISIDADLIFINKIPSEVVDEINDSFFMLYSPVNNKPQNQILNEIKIRIKKLLPEIDINKYTGITFVTNGVPFGAAFSELPTTHLFIYPLLGIHLANAIAGEVNNTAPIRTAVLVDPGEFPETEVETINKVLSNKNTIVRVLSKSGATTKNMHLFTAAYPFDLMYISSHANEAPGYRTTYEYKDSEGINRTLVTDEAIGFSWDPNKQMFYVQNYRRFVSLDGIDWTDKEAKSKHYIGKAILDFTELAKTDKFSDKIKSRENIPNVIGAMAYKMNDTIFIPVFHGLADENTPVVISNACSSWRRISNSFIFAGARVYIGPIIDVTNVEAVEVMKIFFEKHIHLPICLALWKTLNEIYKDQVRRPYIMAGVHFASLKFPIKPQTDYLIKRLSNSYFQRREKADKDPRKDVRSHSKDFAEFFDQEIKSFAYSMTK